jgi:hypothetical protein
MAPSLDDVALVQAPLTGAPPLVLAAALLARMEGVPTATVLDASLTDVRRRLLAARRARLGAELTALTQCPACEETIEASLQADAMLAAIAAAPDAVSVRLASGESITVTAPSTQDVLDAARAGPEQSAALLCQRVCDAALDPDDAQRLEDALEAADPFAAGIALRCPECAAEWTADLDPCAYVVAELADAQRRVIDDVHALASAYGWEETAIAALPAWRRARYREWIER